MKVVPSPTGQTAAARSTEQPADAAAFGAALAKASTEVELRKGEKAKPVEGHAYSEITAGSRKGMYVNTSGNDRHGDAFVLARKRGVEYHIYGTGKDRLVVALKPAADDKPKAESKPKAEAETGEIKLREGERAEPVKGRGYSEIVSGERSGMYVNTGGGKRHGEAFVLVRKDGVEYHIYGSGKDREVVAVKSE
jgi:hypothetical protein